MGTLAFIVLGDMRRRMILLLLAACNQPPGAPTVSIGPDDPTTADDLVALVLGEAVDPNGADTITYAYAWYQDGSPRTDLSGATVPAAETTKGESWKVVVTPNDGKEDGEIGIVETVIVNTPPVATVSLPAAALAVDELVATVETSDADEDAVTVTYAWDVDGVVSDYTGASLPVGSVLRGETWTVTVTPSDDEVAGEPVTASVIIENVAPLLAEVTLAPDPAREADTLVATATGVEDGDGDDVVLNWSWRVNGEVIDAVNTDVLTGEWFSRGDTVEVEVTPNDGFVDGAPVLSNPVSIENTPPIAAGASIEPADAYESSVLSCVSAGWTDVDGDAETYVTTWYVNGVAVSTDATIDGALFDRDDTVRCMLVPDDGIAVGEAVESAEIVVWNTAPTLASASLSTTTPTEDDTLSVSLGLSVDDDGDAVTPAYAWYVNGALVATTATLDGASFNRDDEVYVIVTPSDGTDAGIPVTSDIATVQNLAPVAGSITITPATAKTDDLLTASATTSDRDGDAVTMTYRWSVDGVELSSSEHFDGYAFFSKGQTVYVVGTPNDGTDDGAAVTASITIQNTAPTGLAVAITPASPIDVDAPVVCAVSTAATDPDGDSLTYTIAWTIDGAPFTGATTTTRAGDTVPASAISVGQTVVCSVTPNDGTDDGAAATATATISCDTDHDGADDEACAGGDDCDDSDDSVSPSASEVCGDGIDQNCDGVDAGCGPTGTVSLAAADLTVKGEYAGDNAGWAVAMGDLTDDGIADAVIGAPKNDAEAVDSGGTYIFTGGTTGSMNIGTSPRMRYGETAYDQSGYSVAIGDIDGDGSNDLVTGAPGGAGTWISLGPINSWRVYDASDYELQGAAGNAVTTADIDGDGAAEVVTALYSASKIYVAPMPSTGRSSLATTSSLIISGSSDYAGRSIEGGDVDGDGLDDLLIGASNDAEGGALSGAAYLVLGGASGTLNIADADLKLVGESASDAAGRVVKLGDMDADGVVDMVIGAPGRTRGASMSGAVYIVSGTHTSGVRDLSLAESEIQGDATNGFLSYERALAVGDLDGDGASDLLVGDYTRYRVAAFYGPLSSTVGVADADAFLVSDQSSDYTGACGIATGDADGDGADDVLIGSMNYDGTRTDQGRATLFYTAP